MEKLTPKEKRKLLVSLIEIETRIGYDITEYVGYKLSRFNWDAVKKRLEKMKIEFKQVHQYDYDS